MLVQSHRQVIPDFYGLTTSFVRDRLKPSDLVLADEEGAPWVKYIHGDHGKGTWTFFGGHDPEEQKHQIGDPPTWCCWALGSCPPKKVHVLDLKRTRLKPN